MRGCGITGCASPLQKIWDFQEIHALDAVLTSIGAIGHNVNPALKSTAANVGRNISITAADIALNITSLLGREEKTRVDCSKAIAVNPR